MKLALVPQPQVAAEPEPVGTKYVIRSAHLFWRPDCAGYTNNVLEAGLYTLDQVRKIERNRREPPDVGVRLAQVLAELQINPAVLDALLIEQAQNPAFFCLGRDHTCPATTSDAENSAPAEGGAP